MMTERKWTPGPWVYRPQKYDDWGYVRGAPNGDGFQSFICQAKDMRATEEDENKARREGTDPWAANAHLIAASPDLYDALEWAEDELASYAPDPSCRSKITDDILARVRTALAKARGEQ